LWVQMPSKIKGSPKEGSEQKTGHVEARGDCSKKSRKDTERRPRP